MPKPKLSIAIPENLNKNAKVIAIPENLLQKEINTFHYAVLILLPRPQKKDNLIENL